jgi:hypothetical protein
MKERIHATDSRPAGEMDVSMIQLLIDYGADPCKATETKCWRGQFRCPIVGNHNCNDTPLDVAVDSGSSVEVFRLLIKNGADPNAKDHVGSVYDL